MDNTSVSVYEGWGSDISGSMGVSGRACEVELHIVDESEGGALELGVEVVGSLLDDGGLELVRLQCAHLQSESAVRTTAHTTDSTDVVMVDVT